MDRGVILRRGPDPALNRSQGVVPGPSEGGASRLQHPDADDAEDDEYGEPTEDAAFLSRDVEEHGRWSGREGGEDRMRGTDPDSR